MSRTYATRHDVLGLASNDSPDRTPKPKPKERAPRDGRGDRRRVHPRAPGPGVRGRGVRDPDRLDGPDPDGPAQGDHLPAVRLRLRGQRLGGDGRGDRRSGTGTRTAARGRRGDLRQLPVPGAAGRRAELQGRPHPRDEVPLRPALPAGVLGAPSAGTSSSSAIPEEPEVSYIKRLVGLPGEELRIWLRRHLHQAARRRASSSSQRKPLRHQQAMQMMVYDDRHRAGALKNRPEWRRWIARSKPAGPRSSRRSRRARSPSSAARPGRAGPSCATATSSPTPSSGTRSSNGRELPRPPRPTLITDFYSYNTNLTGRAPSLVDYRGDQASRGCSRTGSAT